MEKFLMLIIACVSFGLLTTVTYADDATQTSTNLQKSYSAKGEVIAIDKVAVKVKLKHEAIPELNWPAMTMFFSVSDKAQLNDLAIGNKVEFQLVKTSSGMPLITKINALK
jgi:Cu(I)/Ag(I) efflux system protein CusF